MRPRPCGIEVKRERQEVINLYLVLGSLVTDRGKVNAVLLGVCPVYRSVRFRGLDLARGL